MLLSQALAQAVLKNPGHPAILDLGKTVSFSQLRNRVSQLSYLFQTEIPAGERVAFLAQNCTAVAQAFLAFSNAGNPVLFLNPTESDEEIASDLRSLEIRHILVTGDQVSRANNLIRDQRLALVVIEVEKKRGGEYDTSFSPPPDRPLKEDQVVLILRQDKPGPDRKYIFFHHKQIFAATMMARRFYRLTPADRILTFMNWAHPFALTHGLLLPLFTGSTCVVDPQSPSVEEFVEFLATSRVTRFVGPPKFYTQLLTYCASQKFTLPGVKSVTVGMGSLSFTIRKTFKLLKIPVIRCYGRTEAIWTLAMDEIEGAIDIENSKCKPGPGVKVKVLNDEGDEIEGKEAREGPLAVMAESVMTSYFHPDKEVAAAATRNRIRGTWLYTDEIARLEGEGEDLTIAVLGKISDMIKGAKGYLSPRRIDDAAKGVRGVSDAAGFVRVDRKGNRSFACAIVPEGKSATEQSVLRALEDALPAEYRPTAVFVVENIPKDEFQSVNRASLQREFSER